MTEATGSSAKDFPFVAYSTKKDYATKRLIRSHARKQQPKPPGRGAEPAAAGTGPTGPVKPQKAFTTKFKLVTRMNKTSRRPPPADRDGAEDDSGGSAEDTGSSDTPQSPRAVARRTLARPGKLRELPHFQMLPIEMTDTTEELLRFYYRGFLANSFALNPEGNWFDMIKGDPAPLHAFFSTMASMHYSAHQLEDDSCVVYHTSRCITHVNERLDKEGKSEAKPISDGVIVAVSLLVNTETTMGRYEAAAAHMSGLKTMVKMRGGLVDGLQHSILLQRAVTWADFAYATAWGQSVAFPLVPRMAHSLGIADRFLTRSTLCTSSEASRLAVRDREVLEALEMLYSTTHAINTFDIMAPRDRLKLSNAIYLTERTFCNIEERMRATAAAAAAAQEEASQARIAELFPLPLASDLTPEFEDGSRMLPAAELSEALMYAAHLFLHMAVRGQPPGARRHRYMTECLWSAILPVLHDMDLVESDISCDDSEFAVSSSSGSGTRESSDSPDSSADAVPVHSVDAHESLLFWILFVGACIRPAPPSAPAWPLLLPAGCTPSSTSGLSDARQAFIYALKRFSRRKAIYTQDELTAQLKQVVWLNGGCAKLMYSLAGDLGMSQVLVRQNR